jgi:predicted nucleic-acid-binding Zn-ribbon protein
MHGIKSLPKECRNCGSRALYLTQVSAGGGYAPNYLPQLGTLFAAAKFNVIVCKNCGETRLFAPPEALDKLENSTKWERF